MSKSTAGSPGTRAYKDEGLKVSVFVLRNLRIGSIHPGLADGKCSFSVDEAAFSHLSEDVFVECEGSVYRLRPQLPTGPNGGGGWHVTGDCEQLEPAKDSPQGVYVR